MTATLRPDSQASRTVPTRSVVVALARLEARRALLHPLTWIGVVGSLWLMWGWTAGAAPILERDSIYVAGALMPLAATTLLVSFYATLRRRRIPEVLATFPVDRNRIVLGLHASVVGPVVVALVLTVAGLAYLLLGAPIGQVSWLELGVGPVMVALGGVAGVFIGRRLPNVLSGPLILLVVAYAVLLASPDATQFDGPVRANFEWISPWMPPSSFVPVEELASRPSALHLVFVMVLIAMLVVLTLDIGARVIFQIAGVAVFLGGVLWVSTNALPLEAGSFFDWMGASENQPCVTRGTVEYCYYPKYESWVADWATTVESIEALAPLSLRRVIQRPDFISWDPDDAVTEAGGPYKAAVTGLAWDRPGSRPNQALTLALTVAGSAVGLPTATQQRPYTEEEIARAVAESPDPSGIEEAMQSSSVWTSCLAQGQARAAAAVWLAATATDGGLVALDHSLLEGGPGHWTWPDRFGSQPVFVGWEDGDLGRRLLDLPQSEVLGTLRGHWDQVVDPSTSSAELASWFGVEAPVYQELGFDLSIPTCD